MSAVREGARRVDTDQDADSEWSVITDLCAAFGLVLAAFIVAAVLVGAASAYWPRLVVWLSF